MSRSEEHLKSEAIAEPPAVKSISADPAAVKAAGLRVCGQMRVIAEQPTYKSERPRTFSEYCEELEMAGQSAAALPSGSGGETSGEEAEWQEALREYRRIERQVKNEVYLGWRRLVLMCEAGADIAEWSKFPLHLLQAAHAILLSCCY